MELPEEKIKSVKITVHYETSRSNGSNDFNSLQELKKWCDAQPKLAEKLGYRKKE